MSMSAGCDDVGPFNCRDTTFITPSILENTFCTMSGTWFMMQCMDLSAITTMSCRCCSMRISMSFYCYSIRTSMINWCCSSISIFPLLLASWFSALYATYSASLNSHYLLAGLAIRSLTLAIQQSFLHPSLPQLSACACCHY